VAPMVCPVLWLGPRLRGNKSFSNVHAAARALVLALTSFYLKAILTVFRVIAKGGPPRRPLSTGIEAPPKDSLLRLASFIHAARRVQAKLCVICAEVSFS